MTEKMGLIKTIRQKMAKRRAVLDNIFMPLAGELRTIYRRRLQASARLIEKPKKLLSSYSIFASPIFIAIWQVLTFLPRMFWRCVTFFPWWLGLLLFLTLLMPVPFMVASYFLIDSYENLDGTTPKSKVEFLAKEYGGVDLQIGEMLYKKPAQLYLKNIFLDDRKNKTLGVSNLQLRVRSLNIALEPSSLRQMKPVVTISHKAKSGGYIKAVAKVDMTDAAIADYLRRQIKVLLEKSFPSLQLFSGNSLPDDKTSTILEFYNMVKGAEVLLDMKSYRLKDIAWISYLNRLPLDGNLTATGKLMVKKGGIEKIDGNLQLQVSAMKLNSGVIKNYPEVQKNMMAQKALDVVKLQRFSCGIWLGDGWISSRNCIAKTNFGSFNIKFSSKIKNLVKKKVIYGRASIGDAQGRFYAYLMLDQRYKRGGQTVFPFKIYDVAGQIRFKLLPPIKSR